MGDSPLIQALIVLLDADVGSAFFALNEGHDASEKHLAHLIRRLVFPCVPVGICVLLALLGHLNPVCTHAIGNGTAWYFVNFAVVAYPFCILRPGPGTRMFSWQLMVELGVVSVGVSLVEFFFNVLFGENLAWAIGFSAYTMIGFVWLPSVFAGPQSASVRYSSLSTYTPLCSPTNKQQQQQQQQQQHMPSYNSRFSQSLPQQYAEQRAPMSTASSGVQHKINQAQRKKSVIRYNSGHDTICNNSTALTNSGTKSIELPTTTAFIQSSNNCERGSPVNAARVASPITQAVIKMPSRYRSKSATHQQAGSMTIESPTSRDTTLSEQAQQPLLLRSSSVGFDAGAALDEGEINNNNNNNNNTFESTNDDEESSRLLQHDFSTVMNDDCGDHPAPLSRNLPGSGLPRHTNSFSETRRKKQFDLLGIEKLTGASVHNNNNNNNNNDNNKNSNDNNYFPPHQEPSSLHIDPSTLLLDSCLKSPAIDRRQPPQYHRREQQQQQPQQQKQKQQQQQQQQRQQQLSTTRLNEFDARVAEMRSGVPLGDTVASRRSPTSYMRALSPRAATEFVGRTASAVSDSFMTAIRRSVHGEEGDMEECTNDDKRADGGDTGTGGSSSVASGNVKSKSAKKLADKNGQRRRRPSEAVGRVHRDSINRSNNSSNVGELASSMLSSTASQVGYLTITSVAVSLVAVWLEYFTQVLNEQPASTSLSTAAMNMIATALPSSDQLPEPALQPPIMPPDESDTVAPHGAHSYSSWRYTLSLYLLLPIQAIVVFADRKADLRFSFPYLVYYAVVGARVPDYLGHASVQIFMMLGQQADEQVLNRPGTSVLPVSLSVDVGRYFVSMGYMLSMSVYMRILRLVTEYMSAPNIFARFLFHAQLYYYFFWYLLITAAHTVDGLFWAMLISMNIHYILSNTGVYDDMMIGMNEEYQKAFKWTTQVASQFGRWALSSFGRCSDTTVRWARRAGVPINAPLRIRGVASLNKRLPRNRSNAGFSTGKRGGKAGMVRGAAAAAANVNVKKTGDSVLLPLLFRIKLADQDSLADLTSLLAIPSLITVFAIFAMHGQPSAIGSAIGNGAHSTSNSNGNSNGFGPSSLYYGGEPLDLWNLWLRFGLMYLARLISQRVSRAVFSHKIRYYRLTLLSESHNVDLLRDEVQQRLWTRVLASSRGASKSGMESSGNSGSGGGVGVGMGSDLSWRDRVVVGGGRASGSSMTHGRKQVHSYQQQQQQQQRFHSRRHARSEEDLADEFGGIASRSSAARGVFSGEEDDEEQQQQQQQDVGFGVPGMNATHAQAGHVLWEQTTSTSAVPIPQLPSQFPAGHSADYCKAVSSNTALDLPENEMQLQRHNVRAHNAFINGSMRDLPGNQNVNVESALDIELDQLQTSVLADVEDSQLGAVLDGRVLHDREQRRTSETYLADMESRLPTPLLAEKQQQQQQQQVPQRQTQSHQQLQYQQQQAQAQPSQQQQYCQPKLALEDLHDDSTDDEDEHGYDTSSDDRTCEPADHNTPKHMNTQPLQLQTIPNAHPNSRHGRTTQSDNEDTILGTHLVDVSDTSNANAELSKDFVPADSGWGFVGAHAPVDDNGSFGVGRNGTFRICNDRIIGDDNHCIDVDHNGFRSDNCHISDDDSVGDKCHVDVGDNAYLHSSNGRVGDSDNGHIDEGDGVIGGGGGWGFIGGNDSVSGSGNGSLSGSANGSQSGAGGNSGSPSNGVSSVTSLHDATVAEFRTCFWYFCLVTISCAFSCFQHPDMPTRFTFCA